MADHNLSCDVIQAPKLGPEDENFCELNRLKGGIYVLQFTGESHHRFSPSFIRCFEGSGILAPYFLRSFNYASGALGHFSGGKFFSNGMDVNYLRESDPQQSIEYLQLFQRLVSKILTFCLPTIAAIRGHAVGAGCIFALAHDYRITSSSRGYIIMNEVNLGMSLTPGIMSVLRSKLPTSTFQEAVLTGKRYDGKSAVEAGISHVTYPTGSDALKEGMRIAMEHKARDWNRGVYQALKMEMFQATIRAVEYGGIGFSKM